MTGPQEQRWFDQAEEWFIFRGLNYDQIMAEIAALGGSVSKATLCAWNKKGGWQDKRGRYLRTRSGVAGQLQQLAEKKLAAMLAEDANLRGDDFKDLTRLLTAIEKFDRSGPDLKTMTVEVMGHFGRYCRDHAQAGELEVLQRHLGGFLRTLEMAA